MRCSVFCAVSLDGTLDGLKPADTGFTAFREAVDIVVMGWNAFRILEGGGG